ncbi:glycosyltransferase family 4 protein [Chthonomonas calidirosea]|uniref:Glycosyltransferase n=1 Tax=Chthonomonas calidirosea (strain DSM 23976 / ICMP 18418 / T49) TaxID=1303518 RepID=S0EVN7_CHTCT|nr:glycosyltransferase family 1 protein [Chthonomonas calidirosea]CCW35491.1 Glycosyltransferase [Chthonomonas calidirosea T49]CEK19130.1 glycosyltransferase [Chthonomonas calidirosea]CEK20114.1 glycosyltransferase [Chthonomonas calidirosea]
MRIGINLLYLLPNHVGGTQTYAEGLIQGLASIDKDNEYCLFVNLEAENLQLTDAPNVRKVVCPVRASSRRARYLYEQLQLPQRIKREGIELLHSCGYVGPLWPACPHIVTVHDLNYIAFGNQMEASRRLMLAFLVPRIARRAARVIAVSEFTRQELIVHIGLKKEQICVIHEAPKARPPCPKQKLQEVRQQFGLDGPYLLAFSSLSPHKNIPFLLEGFSKIASIYSYPLVLVGHTPPGSEVEQKIEQLGLGDRVIRTGYVADDVVSALLDGATLFVFPSKYEGFGLPILEAQQAGVPVVCSQVASLPEVAGEGALYFDPHSQTSLLSALRTALDDDSIRKALRQKGYANVARFSWKKAAEETLALYKAVLYNSNRKG